MSASFGISCTAVAPVPMIPIRAAGRIEVVFPRGGVDDLALERGDPRNVGCLRLGEEPGRGDQVARRQHVATGQRHLPATGLVVPAGAFHDGVEPHVPADVVLVGHPRGVLLDLRSRGEQPRPVRVRFEEIRIRRGGDIDGQARVVVHVPGSAEVVLPVEDDEIVDTQALELDCRADTAEAGPDDEDLEVLRTHGTTIYPVPLVLVTARGRASVGLAFARRLTARSCGCRRAMRRCRLAGRGCGRCRRG